MLGSAALAAVELTLGVDTPVSGLIVREIVVKGLLAFVLALGIVPILRFVLRSALVEDEYGSPIGAGPRPGCSVACRRSPSLPSLPSLPRRSSQAGVRRAAAAAMSSAGSSYDVQRRQMGRRRAGPDTQLSKRIKVLGIFALLLFGLIFFRLWYLQVLSGDKYLAEAQNNRTREVTVQAPRGEILDRDGKVLVGNRTALALQVHTDQLPGSAQAPRPRPRAGRQPGRPGAAQGRQGDPQADQGVPGSPVTLKRDVPFDLVYFIRENQERFPGVSVDRVYVRQYPQGTLGAHLFGYVREVSADQLKEPQYDDLHPGRRGRPGRRRADLRPPAARASTASPSSRSTRLGPADRGGRIRARAEAGQRPRAVDRLEAAGDRRGGARVRPACPAPSSR